MKEKKESWIKRHKILTGILGFLLFLIILGAFSDSNISSTSSEGDLVEINSSLLVPQDLEIDREWNIKEVPVDSINFTGFIEGSEKQMSQSEFFGGSVVIARVYRFDSVDNANSFYAQEKTKIDIRGVKEWSIETNCFGIEKDNTLSGYAKGFCVRNNVVLYVKSVSSSFDYTGDGKKFMKMMLEKL